ncbi:MAG: BamA/TamA family outer membrane protein [Bacteroidia bacterium]|nr:BamA/TamA family outer membrane protein [Bacteroidia bacterium]
MDAFKALLQVGPWSWVSLTLFGWGCSPTRFLSSEERLVAREPILRGHILEERPPLYVRSNSRAVGIRMGLQLYWAGEVLLEGERLPWRLLRRIPKVRYYTYALGTAFRDRLGEPPMLLSQRAVEQDVALLEELYVQQGYFRVAVQPQIKPVRAKEVQVIYRIRPGPRWYVRELDVEGGDSVLISIVDSLLAGKVLPVGEPYQLPRLDKLREELHQGLLAEGYYGLPLSQLIWEIDTSSRAEERKSSHGILRRWIGKRREDAPTCVVKLFLPPGYRRYRFAETELVVHTPDRAVDIIETYEGVRIQTEPRAVGMIDPRVFVGRLFYPPRHFYDQRAIHATQRALQTLEVVQWVGPSVQRDSGDFVHARYDIVLRPPLDVMVGIEGFQSTQPLVGSLPLPGASAHLRIVHLSLFRRAWPLRVRTQAALSYFRRRPEESPLPLYNLLGELSLTIPEKTFRLKEVRPRPLSRTLTQQSHTLLLSYQDIRQIDFSRRYATFSWARRTRFLFQDRRQEEQVWTPFSLTFVDSRFSSAFAAQIEALSPLVRTVILRDYLPRLTQLTAWQVSSNRNYFQSEGRGMGDYSSLLVELGGWVPFFLEHLLTLTVPREDSTYRDNLLFNKFRYGVFVRALADVRLRKMLLSPKQQFVARARLGLAQGLYYTTDVPFENRFFVGGPNSMRAWQFGALGPGRYTFPQNLFLIPGGSFLLELNAEIRQTLFRGIQLAPFVDVGNVWFLTKTAFEDPRGILGRSPWPGVGAGVGLRWDLSVLVIRVDVAQQVFDPAGGWLFARFPVGGVRSQYVFAVGYPF